MSEPIILQHTKKIPKSDEQANDLQKNLETIRKQLEKSGGTIFNLSLKHIEESGISGYYPISVLNQLRREFLDELLELIDKNYTRTLREPQCPSTRSQRFSKRPKYPEESLTYRHNVSNKLAKQFYKKCGVETIEPAFELNPKSDADLMTTKFCLNHEFGTCLNAVETQHATSLHIITSNNEYSIHFDCRNCEMKINKAIS
jgi:putative protease